VTATETPSFKRPRLDRDVQSWRHNSRAHVSKLTNCRSCAGTHLATFLDLGTQPIANALLGGEHLHDPEPKFPLGLAFCRDCGLFQVTQTISPNVLLGREYPYYSLFSPALAIAQSRPRAGDPGTAQARPRQLGDRSRQQRRVPFAELRRGRRY
jgi:putative zinc binding protein